MAFNNFIQEKIILPVSDLFVGNYIAKSLAFLEKSQWWSEQELEDFQNERLRLLIRHAYDNVPYYNDIMKGKKLCPADIKTTKDLNKLPILTKETFKLNYPEKLRARNWKQFSILRRNSSGSTGTPIEYIMSRQGYGFNKACHLRGWYWMGFRLGDRLMKISQNERKSFEKKVQDKLANTLLFSQSYSKENLTSFIKRFQEFRPEFLRSYPDPLYFIASMLKEENITLSGLKAINTTGNILFPEIRNLIESTFKTEVFDTYSCEGGPNYFECETHECYHSSMEYGISEILNENLDEVDKGQQGRLYTTDLWNYVTPFIRYDSKDIVVRSENPCSCGRKLLSITKVIGRDNDIILTPSGKYLIAQTFTTYFKYIPSILQFQIYQDKIDHLFIRLKVNSNYNKAIEKEISEYWKNYIGSEMKLDIETMADLPLAPSGKRRFVLRECNIPNQL